ncbi:hypothetical protein HRG_000367 [Hirsutella rhossiliensis]|uniref:Uncharacterized protein n=1 Tax=Hirsutella rhossiliensis TaxID=111463 RepID=A0A9P8N6A1_9HYPO|nr:uncharacterized protein HRG_00367 [Hirsutella rhossiliensis]KAH0967725.1 hypothetical protein HRG_00367 [Hirsutella rhossiliensis]
MKYRTGALIAMCLTTGTFAAPTSEKPTVQVKAITEEGKPSGSLGLLGGSFPESKYIELGEHKKHKGPYRRSMEFDAKESGKKPVGDLVGDVGKALPVRRSEKPVGGLVGDVGKALPVRRSEKPVGGLVGDVGKALPVRRSMEVDAETPKPSIPGEKRPKATRRSMEFDAKRLKNKRPKNKNLPIPARRSMEFDAKKPVGDVAEDDDAPTEKGTEDAGASDESQ